MNINVSDQSKNQLLGVIRDSHDLLTSQRWEVGQFAKVHQVLNWLTVLERDLVDQMRAADPATSDDAPAAN